MLVGTLHFSFFSSGGGAEGKTRHVFSFCFGGESWDSFVQAGLPTVPMQFPKTAVTPKVMAAGASLSPRTLGVSRVHIPKLDHSEHVWRWNGTGRSIHILRKNSYIRSQWLNDADCCFQEMCQFPGDSQLHFTVLWLGRQLPPCPKSLRLVEVAQCEIAREDIAWNWKKTDEAPQNGEIAD